MILHNEKESFDELCQAAATHFNIPAIYIEKDYWVTVGLKNLAESEYSDKIIFKGGTSLSKTYKLIKRFSEDIDLAARCMGVSGNSTKQLLRRTEAVVAADYEYQQGHERESKGSKFRKTIHQYTRIVDTAFFGGVSEHIELELNAYVIPEPTEPKSISSYIAEFLKDNSKPELISQFKLESFEVDVLRVERTLVEKILGIMKRSYFRNPTMEWTKKIRHFYDIAMILREDQHSKYLQSDEFISLLRLSLDEEYRCFGEDVLKYISPAMAEAKIFKEVDSSWKSISSAFRGDFAEMVFDEDMPSDEEMLNVLNSIAKRMKDFEKAHPLENRVYIEQQISEM